MSSFLTVISTSLFLPAINVCPFLTAITIYLFITALQCRCQLALSLTAIQHIQHLVILVYVGALIAVVTWLCDSFLPFRLNLALTAVAALVEGHSFGRPVMKWCSTLWVSEVQLPGSEGPGLLSMYVSVTEATEGVTCCFKMFVLQDRPRGVDEWMEIWKSAALVGANLFTLLMLFRGEELWMLFTRNIDQYDSPSTGVVLVCLEAIFWVLSMGGGAKRVMKARNWIWRIDSELKLYWLKILCWVIVRIRGFPFAFLSVILTPVYS
jgi:hypothetical protein